MSESETEYYRRRAAEERAMALKSERSDVAAIHQELAKQYQALVDQAQLRPRQRMVAEQASS
jgi:pyridoxine/pyridoxamine 5'-phosphate oxidase